MDYLCFVKKPTTAISKQKEYPEWNIMIESHNRNHAMLSVFNMTLWDGTETMSCLVALSCSVPQTLQFLESSHRKLSVTHQKSRM